MLHTKEGETKASRRKARSLVLALLALGQMTIAAAYSPHDVREILTTESSPAGIRHSVNLRAVDQILKDISRHAGNYPPTFSTAKERQIVEKDIQILGGALEILINGPNPTPEMLLRVGVLYSMGHNLDIDGAAQKSEAIFKLLLQMVPEDPLGNYHYGVFLAGTNRALEALPYLRKARKYGILNADYSLGLVYLALGNKREALTCLRAYADNNKNDLHIRKLIDKIN